MKVISVALAKVNKVSRLGILKVFPSIRKQPTPGVYEEPPLTIKHNKCANRTKFSGETVFPWITTSLNINNSVNRVDLAFHPIILSLMWFRRLKEALTWQSCDYPEENFIWIIHESKWVRAIGSFARHHHGCLLSTFDWLTVGDIENHGDWHCCPICMTMGEIRLVLWVAHPSRMRSNHHRRLWKVLIAIERHNIAAFWCMLMSVVKLCLLMTGKHRFR